MKLRTLFLFLIIFFAVFSAYQYSSNRNENTSNIVETSEGYFRVFAFNNSTDGNLVLRANSTSETPYLELGTFSVTTTNVIVYTGALALSNEMKRNITVTGVDVADTQRDLSTYTNIYLHNNTNILAENENGELIFENGTSYQFYWSLSTGDGNYSTVIGGTLLYSSAENIYYSTTNINASGRDFVWVEIKIYTGGLRPSQTYTGYITFYYKYGAIKLWYHLTTTP